MYSPKFNTLPVEIGVSVDKQHDDCHSTDRSQSVSQRVRHGSAQFRERVSESVREAVERTVVVVVGVWCSTLIWEFAIVVGVVLVGDAAVRLSLQS